MPDQPKYESQVPRNASVFTLRQFLGASQGGEIEDRDEKRKDSLCQNWVDEFSAHRAPRIFKSLIELERDTFSAGGRDRVVLAA